MSDPQQINGFLPSEDPDAMSFVHGLHLWTCKQWKPVETPNIYTVYRECFEPVLHLSPALQKCLTEHEASKAKRRAAHPEEDRLGNMIRRMLEEWEEQAQLDDMLAPTAGGW